MTEKIETDVDTFKELSAMAPNASTTPVEGVAAIALTMAMKFCDINTVQDGVLYQQYKMEGKNMSGLHLDQCLMWRRASRGAFAICARTLP